MDGLPHPADRRSHDEEHNRLVTPRTRPDLESIPAYVPGRSFPGAVKLASNETTIGPLPSVREAIADAAAGSTATPTTARPSSSRHCRSDSASRPSGSPWAVDR